MTTDIRTPIATNGGDWIRKFGETWKSQIERLKIQFGDAIENIQMPDQYPTDVPIIYVKKERVTNVLSFLKTSPEMEYTFLADLTASDEGGDPRFEVVYNLFSVERHYRIRVKTRVEENQSVPTACAVWAGANWAEREVWDMYGIRFEGHPDLRRILNDVRFEGFALRKDYPIRGYQIFIEPEDAETHLLE